MRAVVSQSPTSFSGLVTEWHLKKPLGIQRCSGVRFNVTPTICLFAEIPRGGTPNFATKPSIDKKNKKVLYVGRDNYKLSYEDDLRQEPFWLGLVTEAIWALRSLFVFLVEQPSQLKYIEWPSFHSTLKTAALTLVIVALLIVALSSVDSILCYLLALILRRPA